MSKKILLIFSFCFLIITSLFATDYYVSALSGSNSNNGLTQNSAFKTIQTAVNKTNPGDTVFVMDGIYNSTSGPILNLTPANSGTIEKYITYKALPGQKPKITASKNVWNAVSINASYIVLDGFELEGNNANTTYEDAYQSYEDYINGIKDWAKIANFNTNALTVGGPSQESKLPHHVIVRNCVVHDFPGAGLNSIQADYVTFENNLVYNNAWYMMYAGSGISILNPYNSDTTTTYRNIVRNNICHTNKTTIPWVSGQKLSDGNGIIIDVNVEPYSGGPTEGQGPYEGRTLVSNNLSINNGGSGMHSYKANHVDIVNNTAYHNGIVVGYPDIFTNNCYDVNILNNIVYSRDDGESNSNPRHQASEIYDYNIYFNGRVGKKGVHDKVADPDFVNMSLNLEEGDFRLKVGSPAIDNGTAYLAPIIDLNGNPRPYGVAIDCGAYEFENTTKVSNVQLETNAFHVYPNPAYDKINIESSLARSSRLQVSLLNLQGQTLMNKSFAGTDNDFKTLQFDTNITSGVYLLKLSNNEFTQVKPIIINR